MLLACVVAAILMAASIFMHYEALRLIAAMLDQMRGPPRRLLLLHVSATMTVHVAVIGVWAFGYWIAGSVLGLGELTGRHARESGGHFIFSAEAYTSLGLGDINLAGPVRLLAGLQALTGLMMIAWSATFTFVAIQRFWEFHGQPDKKARHV